jgi:glycerol uptake facilitator protein
VHSTTTPRLTAELLGTAMLVFFGVGALVASNGQGFVGATALLAATIVISWIFGGHFNPWITLAAAIRGTVDWLGAMLIIVAQLAGGVLGALLMWAIYSGDGISHGLGVTRLTPEASSGAGLIAAIVAETLAVFLLACVVFAVGEGRKLGVAMGLSYAVGTLAIFTITAASMNFARTLGPEVVLIMAVGQDTDWESVSQIWVYAVSGVLGAALAGLLYPLWRPSDSATTPAE